MVRLTSRQFADHARERLVRVAPFVLGQYAVTICSFGAGVIIARQYGAAARGAFVVLSVLDEFLLRVIGLGLPEVAGRVRAQSPNDIPRLAAAVRRCCLRSALLCVLPAVLLAREVFGLSGAGAIVIGVGCAALPGLGAWRSYCRYVAFADGRSRLATAIPTVQWLCTAGALWMFAMTGIAHGFALLLSYGLGSVASTLLGSTAVQWPEIRAPASVTPLLRNYGRFAGAAVVGSVGTLAVVRLDQVVVYWWLGSAPAGQYAAAAALSGGVLQLGNALAWYGYGAATATVRPEVSASRLNRATIAVGIVSWPLAAVAPEAITFLYGDSFAGGGRAAQILLLVAPFQARLVVFLVASAGAGIPSMAARAQLLALAVDLLLVFPLSSAWGVTGAAIASAAAYSAAASFGDILRIRDRRLRKIL